MIDSSYLIILLCSFPYSLFSWSILLSLTQKNSALTSHYLNWVRTNHVDCLSQTALTTGLFLIYIFSSHCLMSPVLLWNPFLFSLPRWLIRLLVKYGKTDNANIHFNRWSRGLDSDTLRILQYHKKRHHIHFSRALICFMLIFFFLYHSIVREFCSVRNAIIGPTLELELGSIS